MSAALLAQLEAFALAHGGRVRHGRQPERPPSVPGAGIGPSEKPRDPPRDPYLEYTDDYSLWSRSRRGE